MLDHPSIPLPVGVRDFLPQAAARRRSIAEAFLAEFERWGYARIITPAFEYADVLARGLGEDARRAVIRFVEPATGQVVALRPDITPQVARVVATRLKSVGGPLRLCYEGSVLRLLSGARGQREIIQAGVELVDAPSPEGDAEVIALAAAALSRCGFEEVSIDVGHVALVRDALSDLPEGALRAEVLALCGRKDTDGVADALSRGGVPATKRRLLCALLELHGDASEVLAEARRLPLDGAGKRALAELEGALSLALDEGYDGRLTVDLGDVRGFEYYTGLRFAGYVAGVGEAVLTGGRYDHLIGRYGRPARATGFAIDVENVAQAQKAQGVPPAKSGAPILVVDSGGRLERAVRLARALRAAGARASAHLLGETPDDDLVAYAAGAGFGRVLVAGPRSARVLDATGGGASTRVPQKVLSAALGGKAKELFAALGTPPRRKS